MKSVATSQLDARTKGINAAMRRAAKSAAARARATGPKLSFVRYGKLIVQSP